MSTFKETRDALMADLAPLGVPIVGEWPIQASAPCVFIVPPLAGYYATGGRELTSYVYNLDAVILVERRPPDEGREDLETLLEALLLNTVDWALLGVDPPSAATVQESTIEFLGTVVHLGKTIYLKGM